MRRQRCRSCNGQADLRVERVPRRLHDVEHTLGAVPAVALCGGTALYLLRHIAFLYRTTGRIFRRRIMGAGVLLLLIPVATVMSALTALAVVSAVCVLVVAWEVIRYRTDRTRVRHPEPT